MNPTASLVEYIAELEAKVARLEGKLWALLRQHIGFVIFIPEPEGKIYQRDQCGDLHQRTNDPRESLPAVDAEDADSHRNGKLKVVSGSGECDCRILGIIGTYALTHDETENEHDSKVNGQRDGDAHNIHGNLYDQLTFQAEHNHDRKQ